MDTLRKTFLTTLDIYRDFARVWARRPGTHWWRLTYIERDFQPDYKPDYKPYFMPDFKPDFRPDFKPYFTPVFKPR